MRMMRVARTVSGVSPGLPVARMRSPVAMLSALEGAAVLRSVLPGGSWRTGAPGCRFTVMGAPAAVVMVTVVPLTDLTVPSWLALVCGRAAWA